MKICTFCGYHEENNARICSGCGSKEFESICPNCSKTYKGKFCPSCGTRFDAVAKVCPDCGRKYFSKSCPDCGYNESRRRVTRKAAPSNAGRPGDVNSGFNRKNITVAYILGIAGFLMCVFPAPMIGYFMAYTESRKEGLSDEERKQARGAAALCMVTSVLSFMWLIIIVMSGVRR